MYGDLDDGSKADPHSQAEVASVQLQCLRSDACVRGLHYLQDCLQKHRLRWKSVTPIEPDIVSAVGIAHTPIDLSTYDQVVTLEMEFFDGLSHHNFGFATGVSFSTVEEVDTSIISSFHAIECNLVSYMSSVCDPASERDDRYLKTGAAKETWSPVRAASDWLGGWKGESRDGFSGS